MTVYAPSEASQAQGAPSPRAATTPAAAPASAELVPGTGLRPADLRAVAALRAQAMPRNTRRNYRNYFRRFSEWCQLRGLRPLPCEPLTLATYLADMEREGLTLPSLQCAAAAIHAAHLARRLDSPRYDLCVREVIKAVSIRQADRKRAEMAPVTPEMLERMVTTLPYTLNGLRDKAILLVGWAAALRRSELVALDVSDVTWNEKGATLLIRKSKTDQTGQGQVVPIFLSDRLEMCPVRHLRAWLGRARILEGPIFRRISRAGRVNEKRMDSDWVRQAVKDACRRIRVKEGPYGAHSLRAGFITAAAEAGRPLHEIQRTSRHKDIDVLIRYIRPLDAMTHGAGRGLLDRKPQTK